MKPGKEYIGVGVGAVMLNEHHEILLLLRKKPPEAGCWSIPGGKVEFFDTLEDSIIREIKEELNVEIEVIKLLGVTNHVVAGEKTHWVAPTYLAEIKSGTITNMEPDKHGGVQWFSLDQLPKNITITTKAAVGYLSGEGYDRDSRANI